MIVLIKNKRISFEIFDEIIHSKKNPTHKIQAIAKHAHVRTCTEHSVV